MSKVKGKKSKKGKRKVKKVKVNRSGIVVVELSPGKHETEKTSPALVNRTAERLALEYCKRRSDLKDVPFEFIRLMPHWVKKPPKKDTEPYIENFFERIKKLKPKLVILLGQTIAEVLNKTSSFDTMRGWWNVGQFHQRIKVPTILTYDGAQLLTKWSRVYDTIMDFNEVARVVKNNFKPKRVKYEKFFEQGKYVICDTIEKVKAAVKECEKSNLIAVDIETTGLKHWKDEILCIGLSPAKHRAFVIPLKSSRRICPSEIKVKKFKKSGFRKINRTMETEGLVLDKEVEYYEFWNSPKEEKQVLSILRKFFNNPKNKFAGQNVKFDNLNLRRKKIKPNIVWDSMTASRVQDENRPSNLNYLCQWHGIRYGKYDEKNYDYIPRDDKKDRKFADIPNYWLWLYQCVDADVTWQLEAKQRPIIDSDENMKRIMYDIQLPMRDVFEDVEFRGVKIDVERMKNIAMVYETQVEMLDKALRKAIRKHPKCKGFDVDEFKIGSGPKKKNLLFERLQLPSFKLTDKGDDSTSSYVLEKITEDKSVPKKDREIAKYILNIGKCKSIVTNMLGSLETGGKSEGYLGFIDKYGYAHTSYQIDFTKTGRLSSRGINLQNVRRAGSMPEITGRALKMAKKLFPENWKRVRKAHKKKIKEGKAKKGSKPDTSGLLSYGEIFIPYRDGNCILSLDYKALELRIMMWLSGDQNGLREFSKGLDMHTQNASLFFDVKPEDVSPLQRYDSKTSGFSLNYGGGVKTMMEKTGVDYEEAKRREHLYFNKKYTRIKKWWDEGVAVARKQGYVENFFGRRRNVGLAYKFYSFVERNIRGTGAGSSKRWINMLVAHVDRQVYNFPIQSFAADLMNYRIIELNNHLKKYPKARIILQVHDDVTIDIPKKKKKKILRNATRILEWKNVPSPSRFAQNRKFKKVDFLIEWSIGEHWIH